MIRCEKCGKTFEAGNRPDGIPNGFGLMMENRRTINICADCMIALGGMDNEQRQRFIEEINADPVQ